MITETEAIDRQAEGDAPGLGEALDDAREFAASILYAPDTALDALVLALAVSHNIDLFNTVPRLLFTSDEPESGKTTALDLVVMLGFNAWMADPTGFALRAKFNEKQRVLLVQDEISKIFGTSGLRGQANPIYKILVEGYRRTALLSLSVDRTSVDVSSYSMAAAGGLRTAAPNDLRTRCIIFPMKPVPASVPELRSSVDFDTWAEAEIHQEQLHQAIQAEANAILLAYRSQRPAHRKLRGRLSQIWSPLFAVAKVAGGGWPRKVLDAFKELALDASDKPVLSPTQMILRDAAALFASTGAGRLFAVTIADHLRQMPDVELYQVLTDRRMAQLMTSALGQTTAMSIGGQRARGFYASQVLPVWDKLNAALTAADAQAYEPDEFDTMLDGPVTEVTQTRKSQLEITA